MDSALDIPGYAELLDYLKKAPCSKGYCFPCGCGMIHGTLVLCKWHRLELADLAKSVFAETRKIEGCKIERIYGVDIVRSSP